MRHAPIDLSPDEFRRLGHHLVDQVADLLGSLPSRKVAPGEAPRDIRRLLPQGGLPADGMDAGALLAETTRLLFEHSTFNGHPRFFGYITASAAPIGILGDMLAAAINPNVGSFSLSPTATEIERQALRWVAEMVGFPTTGTGIFVSGGNVANLVCFLAARAARAPWDLRTRGLTADDARRLVFYGSAEMHTWVQKAADISGLGTDAIRWMPTDERQRVRVDAVRRRLEQDAADGALPFFLVATAGTTGTGAIDPLSDLAALCREHGVWFHVDGAYGAPAAVVPALAEELRAIADADSIAVDPHKWLYAPLEAGCALVRDARALESAFHYRPSYYTFDGEDADPPTNFYELGPQNSRGFRALKVWLALRQVGRDGYRRMIEDDIALTRRMFELVEAHPELAAATCALSIATFAYVPRDLREGWDARDAATVRYVNDLNEAILSHTQAEGGLYLSNAVLDGRFLLRACIVNFRTSREDVAAVPELIVEAGRRLDATMRAGSAPALVR